MKKLIIYIFVLTFASTLFISCVKEMPKLMNLKNESEFDFSNIQSDERMLIFSNFEDYEMLINNPDSVLVEEFLNYISEMNYRKYSDYLSTLSEEELETIEFDDYFSFILNEDCIVQIGNYLYKVNTSTEKVYVMHEEFIEDYDYLVAENLENGHIQEYSTDDDVIYNVEGWDTPDKSCGGIGGGTYLAYGTKISDGLVIGYIGQYPVFLNPWVNMFRAGVYFRLSANFRLESPHPYLKEKGINIQVQVKGPQGGWCKRHPCCGSCEYTLSAEQIIINADENTISSSYTFYSGSRNLNGYYFFIRARNATAQPPYNQWTSYAGRNINSPY